MYLWEGSILVGWVMSLWEGCVLVGVEEDLSTYWRRHIHEREGMSSLGEAYLHIGRHDFHAGSVSLLEAHPCESRYVLV